MTPPQQEAWQGNPCWGRVEGAPHTAASGWGCPDPPTSLWRKAHPGLPGRPFGDTEVPRGCFPTDRPLAQLRSRDSHARTEAALEGPGVGGVAGHRPSFGSRLPKGEGQEQPFPPPSLPSPGRSKRLAPLLSPPHLNYLQMERKLRTHRMKENGIITPHYVNGCQLCKIRQGLRRRRGLCGPPLPSMPAIEGGREAQPFVLCGLNYLAGDSGVRPPPSWEGEDAEGRQASPIPFGAGGGQESGFQGAHQPLASSGQPLNVSAAGASQPTEDASRHRPKLDRLPTKVDPSGLAGAALLPLAQASGPTAIQGPQYRQAGGGRLFCQPCVLEGSVGKQPGWKPPARP